MNADVAAQDRRGRAAAAQLDEWELIAHAAADLFDAGGQAWAVGRSLIEELLDDQAVAALSHVALARALGRAHTVQARRLRTLDPAGEAATRGRAGVDRAEWMRNRREALQTLTTQELSVDASHVPATLLAGQQPV